MTRSDLFLAVAKHPADDLISSMHKKIENTYEIVFELQKPENRAFHALAAILKNALEN